MKRSISGLFLLLGLSFATGVFSSAEAGGRYPRCRPVRSLPTTIDRPGNYCLLRNVQVRGGVPIDGGAVGKTAAIVIATNDVVLDLGEHELSGAGVGAGTEIVGVYALARNNVIVRNGTLEGFLTGAALVGGEGNRLERLRATGNTRVGLWMFGWAFEVRENHVLDTGGSTVFDGAIGLAIGGETGLVESNSVVDTLGSVGTSDFGISVSGNHHLVTNNRIIRTQQGLVINGPSKYRDNLTIDVDTPFQGGIDAGNNN